MATGGLGTGCLQLRTSVQLRPQREEPQAPGSIYGFDGKLTT